MTVVLAAIWIASGGYWARISVRPGTYLTVSVGCVSMGVVPDLTPRQAESLGRARVGRSNFELRWGFYASDGKGQYRVRAVPLWPLLLAAVGLTLWFWRNDPAPIRPGRCGHCGYRLDGLNTATCPECGRRTANTTDAEDSADKR